MNDEELVKATQLGDRLKAEYLRLISLEVTTAIMRVMESIRKETPVDYTELIEETASRIYNITNADFEDNFNADHGNE